LRLRDDEEALRTAIVTLEGAGIWSLRIQMDNSATVKGWLAGEPHACEACLAPGRAKGPLKTAQKELDVAQ